MNKLKIFPRCLALTAIFIMCHAVPRSAEGQSRAKFEPSGNRVYHGASLPKTWEEGGLRTQFDQFKKFAGKRLAVITWFASAYEQGRMTSWRNNYAAPLDRVKKLGAVSLIKFSVQDYAFDRTKRIASTNHIALGVYDAYFEEAAEAVRDFRGPVFISINHEMNGTWYPFSEAYPGSGVTASDYVAAWRRIVDIFRRKGAHNAAFVWSPNVPDVGPVPSARYYPGDDYVDWVGVSFYSGNAVEGLDQIYQTYAPRKPFFVTEWATGEDKNKWNPSFPGEAKWVADFFKALETRYPRVKEISWFQWDKSQYGESNYLLERQPEQAQVYSADIKSPRYVETPDDLVITPPGGAVEVPRLDVTPKEIILREPVAPAPVTIVQPKVEAPRRERLKLQVVPREQVLRGQ
ncbi:MAG: hypothetical protein M3347_01595 [Armatimonadota bacterium]|nr:hypothetical protein [Armatimonadota bacterium]